MNATISAADLIVLLREYQGQIVDQHREICCCLSQVADRASDELMGLRKLSRYRSETLHRFVRLYEQLRAALGPYAVVLALRHDSRCEIEIGPTRFDLMEISRTIEGYVVRGEGVFYTLPGLIDRLGKSEEKAA